jgi:chromosome segregation ATPase
MRFKQFIKTKMTNYVIYESLADFSNLKGDIDSIIDDIKSKREVKKKKEQEIEKLREDKKKAKDSKKKQKIADKINKKMAELEKEAEEINKLVDEKQKKEDEGGDTSDSDEEQVSTEKPELPDIEDLPLGKMKDGDIRKLIAYYKDMKKYIDGKMQGAEADKKANYKKNIEGFDAEINDLNSELDGRGGDKKDTDGQTKLVTKGKNTEV